MINNNYTPCISLLLYLIDWIGNWSCDDGQKAYWIYGGAIWNFCRWYAGLFLLGLISRQTKNVEALTEPSLVL
jgi:hypothetical protein